MDTESYRKYIINMGERIADAKTLKRIYDLTHRYFIKAELLPKQSKYQKNKS